MAVSNSHSDISTSVIMLSDFVQIQPRTTWFVVQLLHERDARAYMGTLAFYNAAAPICWLRIRTAWSILERNIFPSPIAPVKAVLTIASMASSTM